MKNLYISKDKSTFSIIIALVYLVLDRDIILYFYNYEWFSAIIMFLSRIIVIVLLLRVLFNNSKIEYNKVFYLLLLYIGVSFVSSYLGGTLREWLSRIVPLLGITAFISCSVSSYQNYMRFINSVSLLYLFLVITNLLLLIFYPSVFGEGGGGERLFLGYKNGIGYALLVGFVFNYLNNIYNRRVYLYLLYVFFHVMTLFYTFSSTNVIVFSLVLFTLYFPAITKFFQKFSITSFLIFYACVFYVVLFLYGFNNLNIPWLDNLLNNSFGKDQTFSERTIIWETVLSKIANKPFLGYGISDYSIFDVFKNGTYVVNMSHNQIIQCLYEGGIISLIVIVVTIWYIFNSIKNTKNRELETFFVIVIIGLLFMFMMETVGFQTLYILLSLAYISLKYYPIPKRHVVNG